MKFVMKNWQSPFASEDRAQSILAHLEDLRRMLIRCLLALAVACVACIPLARPLLRWLQAPLRQVAAQNHYELELITTSPVEGFMQLVKMVFATGVLVSLPFMIAFIARFVFPGLKPRERKYLAYGGLAGAALFAVGVGFGYLLTLPVAVKFMFYFNNALGTTANWKIDAYLGFVLQLLIGFGLAFELPLLLLLLGHLGLVSVAQMRRYRRHVVVGILVLAALLTPPDVASQLEMAIPLYLLYELCILILSLRAPSQPKPMKGTSTWAE